MEWLGPPASSKLGPAENIRWRMREDRLSNRVLADHGDIAAQCRDGWNGLLAQPARIASNAMRGGRAHGS